jgi:hypothetical protein
MHGTQKSISTKCNNISNESHIYMDVLYKFEFNCMLFFGTEKDMQFRIYCF